MDLASDLEKLIKSLPKLDGQTVVHESQQIYGSLKDKQLSLKDRLSSTAEEAMTRQHLEDTQSGQPTPDDEDVDEAILSMWADDIIAKAFDNIFEGIMSSKMEDILDGIRRIVTRWTITSTTLTARATAGDTVITVDNTLRFFAGDEIILTDVNEITEPAPGTLNIAEVIDNTHLRLTDPLQITWPLSNNPRIFKSMKGQYVKAVYIGEPQIISQFPAITVNGTTRSSDWLTTRGTKEKYSIEIGVFVEDSTMEDGYRFLLRMTDLIQTGLKRNIYPLIHDYDTVPLIADMQSKDTYVKVADTSLLQCYDRILIETKYSIFESQIVAITDATTIVILPNSDADYKVSDGAVLIRCHRFIYNSWPAEINYGRIAKGSLLRAAVINYFAEEFETQFIGTFSDPQLK